MTLSSTSTRITLSKNKMQRLLFAVLLISFSSLACTRTLAFVPLSFSSSSAAGTSFQTRSTSNTLDSSISSLTCLEMQKKKGVKKPSSPSSAKGFIGTAAKPSGSFPYAGSVRPGRQSAQKTVSIPSIVKPDYWKTGIPGTGASAAAMSKQFQLPWMIEVKNSADIEKMRAAGSLARDILDLAGRRVQEGVTTDEIDELVHEATIAASLIDCCCCFCVLCCFFRGFISHTHTPFFRHDYRLEPIHLP